jgi:hypothetical protein
MLRSTSQHGAVPMPSRRALSTESSQGDTARDIWFETRWGMAMFVVAACLAASALLFYLALYMAWL